MTSYRAETRPEQLQFHLEVKCDETGVFVAHVREFPGVASQGRTEDEALHAMIFALEQHISVLLRRAQPQPEAEHRGPPSHSDEKGTDHYLLALA